MAAATQITTSDIAEALDAAAEIVLITDGPHTLTFHPGRGQFHARRDGKMVSRCNNELHTATMMYNVMVVNTPEAIANAHAFNARTAR